MTTGAGDFAPLETHRDYWFAGATTGVLPYVRAIAFPLILRTFVAAKNVVKKYLSRISPP
jgi:hypothetical protein